MKTCFKCNEEKPVGEFYRHPQMKDGRLGKCKECTKRDVQKNYRDNIDHYKEYERGRAKLPHRKQASAEYQKTEAGREAMRRSRAKWLRNNPIKRAAHTITGNAIRDGKLIRQPCEVCGEEKVDAHHDDYNYPMSVRWLCRKHHAEHHWS
jgi:hypothetical protein